MIESLPKDLLKNQRVLLGVTGSGKTFTIANVIANVGLPTLILSHNKTLAAQLYTELKLLFPENAVEYFVSYYDYYQPEAYMPQKDLYIEKDASINLDIEKLRHSTTHSLMERDDVIVVSTVSCIYGIGSPISYKELALTLKVGDEIDREELINNLIELQYERNDMVLSPGKFSARGGIITIQPPYMETAYRISLFGDEVEEINEIDVLTGNVINVLKNIKLYSATHYITEHENLQRAIREIERDLKIQVAKFKKEGKLLEAQRLKERVMFDLEQLRQFGHFKGIENYSRYFENRKPGEKPYCLLDYFPERFLLIIDESHVTIPQIRGMYNGDKSRKETLVKYGFRLPAALDNRPLKFSEFEQYMNTVICMSATPGHYELEQAEQIVEQIIRPTGLVDPEVIVKPTRNQVDDIIKNMVEIKNKNERALILTLTKKMAEDLSEYLMERGIKSAYLHSDIDTLERMDLLKKLRNGTYDCIVGINLLREGLDLPEVSLVAILDADKEGFLRSEQSLIQIMGRASRNVNGKVILYADKITNSMQAAISENNRRRRIQLEYNKKHGITPKTIRKEILDTREIMELVGMEDTKDLDILKIKDLEDEITKLKIKMFKSAENLEFEKAAMYRDKIIKLQKIIDKNKK